MHPAGSILLTEVADARDRNVYHEIRRVALFEERGLSGYDPDHPDEHSPANLPLILKIDGEAVGTVRLDRRGDGAGVIRMVAIRLDRRRRGLGRLMMDAVEARADSIGIEVLYVNAARDAVGFYERIGYRPFSWDIEELARMQPGCVQMRKAVPRASAAGLPAKKDVRRLSDLDLEYHDEFRRLEPLFGVPAPETLDERISLSEVGREWAVHFQRVRAQLAVQLPGAEIEHIGSTAVPGMTGKPVLDVMIGLGRATDAADAVRRLESAGYESLGICGIPGRWALRWREGNPDINIALVGLGGGRWRQALAIRDHLRAHPESAAGYSAAKRAAVAAGIETLYGYSDAKACAIDAIATQAGAG